MKLDPKEVRDGRRWLVLAGAVAVSLTIALYSIDNMLTFSTVEVDKGNLLRTLRTAQAGLSNRAYGKSIKTDNRLKGSDHVSSGL